MNRIGLRPLKNIQQFIRYLNEVRTFLAMDEWSIVFCGSARVITGHFSKQSLLRSYQFMEPSRVDATLRIQTSVRKVYDVVDWLRRIWSQTGDGLSTINITSNRNTDFHTRVMECFFLK